MSTNSIPADSLLHLGTGRSPISLCVEKLGLAEAVVRARTGCSDQRSALLSQRIAREAQSTAGAKPE